MRRQLAGLVAATTSLVLLALLVPAALLLRSQAEQRAIAEATVKAQSIAQLVPTLKENSGDLGPGVTVFLADGKQIGARARRNDAVKLAATGRAFVASANGGVEVLVPTSSSDTGIAVVRVFVSDAALHQGVTRTLLILVGIVLVVFGLGIVVADRLARRTVQSVTKLASTADRLATGDLSVRVEPSGSPEIKLVGQELNRLAARINELLSAEREEVADLAHRLRTPLTALRMNIDNVGDAEQAERLSDSVAVLASHVDELIRTARRPIREGAAVSGDLAKVAAERLRFWSALAEDDGRELSGSIVAFPVPVRADEADLAAALDVLLDNAFRHTPDGSAIRVVVGEDRAVTIDDAGEGFSASARRREASVGFTGLGLDIARRTAKAAGGGLVMGDSPLGGARVRLRFGPPA